MSLLVTSFDFSRFLLLLLLLFLLLLLSRFELASISEREKYFCELASRKEIFVLEKEICLLFFLLRLLLLLLLLLLHLLAKEIHVLSMVLERQETLKES